MKIPLEIFRSAIKGGLLSDHISLIDWMVSAYGLSFETARDRYNAITTAANKLPYDFVQCAWTNYTAPRSQTRFDHLGSIVCSHGIRRYGVYCYVCDELYHKEENLTFTVIVSAVEQRLICLSCASIRQLSFDIDTNLYYVTEDLMTRMTNKGQDWDKITFPNAAELFDSYSYGNENTFPRVISENIHNKVFSHNANPLQYRKSFVYIEGEPLPLIPHWMGVELEVNANDLGISTPGFFYKVASTLNKFAILKHDGSLERGGFEICTVPATLQAHNGLWSDFFDKAAPLLRSWATGRYGMHVHMNKAFFNQSEIGKALAFVNASENERFIEKVAGRHRGTYTRYYPDKTRNDHFREAKIPMGNHYDALSVSHHTEGATMELRIFRGNVSREGFFKNLEFTDALAHFVKDTSARELSSKDFMVWIVQSHLRKRYQHFLGWAAKHKMLLTKDGKPMEKFSLPKTEKLNYETV